MRLREFQSGPVSIGYKNFNFLITDRPSDQTIYIYTNELKKHNVTAVVRVCEPSYNTSYLENVGIEVHNLVYEDGMYPPKEVVSDWFDLLKMHFAKDPEGCIAVHCVAGLGRAPVMVALALLELGLSYEDAVEAIREKKRGAFNSKQLQFLKKYRPKSRLKMKTNKNYCCIQ